MIACCQIQPPEEADETWDVEEWDCETCPRRLWMERLTADDQEAFEVYRWLSDPAVKDLGLHPVVWQALGVSLRRGQIWSLLERLSAIHQYAIAKAREQAKTESHG